MTNPSRVVVSKELHMRLKIEAAKQGTNVSALVTRLVVNGLYIPKRKRKGATHARKQKV